MMTNSEWGSVTRPFSQVCPGPLECDRYAISRGNASLSLVTRVVGQSFLLESKDQLSSASTCRSKQCHSMSLFIISIAQQMFISQANRQRSYDELVHRLASQCIFIYIQCVQKVAGIFVLWN